LVSHRQLLYILPGRAENLLHAFGPDHPSPVFFLLLPGPCFFIEQQVHAGIDNILIAMVAIIGLNIVTGFAG
jgi:hypothetical protein